MIGRRLRLFLALSGITAAATLLHCSGPDRVDGSDSNHTAGEFTMVNAPYVWTDTDYETFRRVGTFFGGGAVLPPDHPASVRLQLWLDRLHEVVGANVKAKTGRALAAPRPIIKVMNVNMANAWVTPIQGCVGGPVDLTPLSLSDGGADGAAESGIGPDGGPSLDLVVLSGDTLKSSWSSCVAANNWDPAEVPAWYTSLGRTCKLSGTPSGLTVSGDCGRALSSYARAKQLALSGSATYVTFTTKMLSLLDDERAAVAVLAHELGHYYLSHAAGFGQYDYWYAQENPPKPGKPEAVRDSAEFQKRYEKFTRQLSRAVIDGERLNPRLRNFEFNLAGGLGQTGLDPSCAEAAAALNAGLWRYNVLYSASLTDDDKRTFLDFQTKLMTCASRVMVKNDAGPGSFPMNSFRTYTYALEEEVRSPDPAEGTLESIFETLDQRARALDAEMEAFRIEMNERHLGHYSYEQEADEFSMDLLSNAGLDPKDHVTAWLEFTKALANDPGTKSLFSYDGIPFTECLDLYQSGWTRTGANGQKEYVYIPLGTMNDPHHGFCYRLFNLSREVDAHQYVTHGAPPETSVPWTTVRDAARQALEALSAPRDAGSDGGGDAGMAWDAGMGSGSDAGAWEAGSGSGSASSSDAGVVEDAEAPAPGAFDLPQPIVDSY